MSEWNGNRASKGISRRSFLELTGAAGVGGLLASSMLTSKAFAASGEVNGINTSWFGLYRSKTVDGRFVSSAPFEGTRYKNEAFSMMPEYVYSPTRIKYPMVRKSYLEGGPGANREARGQEGFVRVSWKEASDLIAKEITRVIADHGNASIMTSIDSAYLHPGRVTYEGASMGRLSYMLGGFTNCSGDYSTHAGQMIMPYVTGSTDVYAQQTSYTTIMENTEVMVFWGCNPKTTLRASFAANMGYGLEWLDRLKEAGKKVIVIDPRRSSTAKHFDAEWIAPAPNTDVAMMLGMAYALHEKDLVNTEFLDEYTSGYDKFLPYLLGETDDTPKTPEWASEICQIEADKIRELAELFASNPTMLFSGWSMQRADHGEQAPWMFVTLAAMIGQIGQPGTGYSMGANYGDNGSPLGTAPALPYMDYGDYPDDHPAYLPAARTTDALLNPGKEIDFAGEKVTYPDIKMIFCEYGNPQTRHPDRAKMIEAWKKPDTIVMTEIFWTATARMADIVLPIASPAEVDDVDADSVATYITPIKKVIEPLYESKSGYDAFTEIADALGIKDKFTKGKTSFELVEVSYEAARKQAKDLGTDMPPFAEFWEKGEPIAFPIDEAGKDFVQHGDFIEDPLLEPLGTATGKIEIYSKDIEKMGYADCGPHPTWFEPVEWLGSEKAANFPLHMVTAHTKFRMHSQYNQLQSLRNLYTVADREPVTINAEDAKARGIVDGDIVRVFNDRGETLAGALVSEDIRPGVIKLSEGGWYDPVEPGVPGSLCKYGHANALVADKPTSSFAQGNNANTALVQVEKFAGEAPPVTIFDGMPEA